MTPKLQTQSTHANWWGDFKVPVGGSLEWQIGAFSLQVLRREKEWLILHRQLSDSDLGEEVWKIETDISLDFEEDDLKRHIFSGTTERLKILPKLADRPVVVNAAKPLHIQPGQQIDIFVSTPLWYSVQVDPSDTELQELPIVRPSDTWFGPSTMRGELCYSSTTQGRLYLEDLPPRPHRAISPIKIKNYAAKVLVLNQLSLPVPFLSLFDTAKHGLWTEAITLLNEDETDLAKVTFADSPPTPFKSAKKISKAREKKEKNMILHTFSTLFG